MIMTMMVMMILMMMTMMMMITMILMVLLMLIMMMVAVLGNGVLIVPDVQPMRVFLPIIFVSIAESQAPG